MRFPAPLILAILLAAAPSPAQPLEVDARTLDLGTVIGDEPVERSFTVSNRGSAPVRIRDVQLTPPLSVVRMKAVVEPGQSSPIVIRLGTPRPPGRFEGRVSVNFEGSDDPLVLEVAASPVPPIELRPGPELVATTDRGTEAHDSVEIVNHLKEPVEISGGNVTSDRWATTIETLEPGRRWRLTLRLTGKGAAGKRVETLTLATNHPRHPTLPVRVRTLVRERVYTFPERVDFGGISQAAVDAEGTARYETSVMVYQKGGSDFQVRVSTDVPFLVVRPERSTKFGDRWQLFLSVDPARLATGQSGGSLTIETNDAEFPKLVIPVAARVE